MKIANRNNSQIFRHSPLRVAMREAPSPGLVSCTMKSEQANLVFDSALQTAGTDVRSGSVSGRQLLYKAGNVCIDMHMQSQLGSDSVVLIGQLLDSDRPSQGLPDIPVLLLCEGDTISSQTTNSFGEFDFGIETPHNLQLVFGIGQRRPLIVSMPDMQENVWRSIT